MRKLFLILMTVIACSWSLAAQTRTIHGTVLDAANNEPLIGASILPVGGGQGTAADIDGHFTLTVPDNVKKAKITYVGYNPQTVDLKDGMTVYLASSDTSLDDVVVVAYGTANKESLTGSVAVIGSKEIEDRPLTAVTAALEGNAPGVQVASGVGSPGSEPTIRIRGFNSFSNNSPLIVVDGVPYDGSISDINPNDVESMSVLKDAASAALYGNRGANGVVLITTKKAKKVGKVDVTLSIRQGMVTKGIPFYDRLGANDWMQQAFTGQVNGYVSGVDGATYDTALEFMRANFIDEFAKVNIYGKANDELFDENGKFVGGNPLKGYSDRNWWKKLSQTGHRQEYNLNAAAATEKFNVFASVGYLKTNGYLINTDFERYNARINANFNPTSYLRFGVNMSASVTSSEFNGGAGSSNIDNPFQSQFTAPIYPYYAHNEDGSIMRDASGKPVWNTASYLQNTNICWSTRLDKYDNNAIVADASVYGTAIIPYGFELTVRGNIHRDKTHQTQYSNNQVGSSKGSGGLQQVFADYRNYNFMQTLTWGQNYGDHHVDVLLDHENYQYTEGNSIVYNTDQSLPDVYVLSNFVKNMQTAGSSGMIRSESYLGRVRYDYQQKYFGEFSLRRDGSSKFSKKHRWGTFWSVGASWVITKEKFMQHVNWLNYLKLRAAYGEVGNSAAASAYAYRSLYAYGLPYSDLATLNPTQLAAENLKWESTNTFDIALEASMLNDRLNVQIGYFDKRNADLINNVTLPASGGMLGNDGYNPSIQANIGTMSNKGLELAISGDVIRTPELTWSLSADLTYMKNKIISMPNHKPLISTTYARAEGHSIYEFYMYKWAGVDRLTGNSLYEINRKSLDYIDYDINGKKYFNENKYNTNLANAENSGHLYKINGKLYTDRPEYASRDFAGSALPTVYGSFGTTLTWKGLNFGLLFTYNIGGKVYDSQYQSLMSPNSNAAAIHKDALKSWTHAPAGMTADSKNRIDKNGIPRYDSEMSMFINASSTQYLIDASNLTLKNLNISYDLPKKWMTPLQLQGINIGFQVDNLFTVTKRTGLNPGASWNGSQSDTFVAERVYSFLLTARF